MAVLRSMMIGALNDEVNAFERPPFSELSVSERQSFQLQRTGLIEEVVRRAYFLYYVDEKDPKRIFACTRNQFPKPGMWTLERCIEWLNHPIRQLATQDELIWMRQEYESFLIVSTARHTALRQEREAAFAASQQAAAKLLGATAPPAASPSPATMARYRREDYDDHDEEGPAVYEERPLKRRRGRPSREESALLQVLQSNNSVCLSLEKAVVGVHRQNTLLVDTICLQTELATLHTRQSALTALLIARETTRDRRVELKATGGEIPQSLVDDAVADCSKTLQDLQALQEEINAVKDQVHEKMGKATPAATTTTTTVVPPVAVTAATDATTVTASETNGV